MGNSSRNIRSGEASLTEKSKQITQAIFGYGTHDEEVLGRVYIINSARGQQDLI